MYYLGVTRTCAVMHYYNNSVKKLCKGVRSRSHTFLRNVFMCCRVVGYSPPALAREAAYDEINGWV